MSLMNLLFRVMSGHLLLYMHSIYANRYKNAVLQFSFETKLLHLPMDYLIFGSGLSPPFPYDVFLLPHIDEVGCVNTIHEKVSGLLT